ncbi:MAG: SRPBCC domain-containing protein [Bryobacteraceae bacterium]
MKTFEAAVTIRATPESVWRILTDANGYPEWNTTVDRVDGRIAPGEKVTVRAKISPGRGFPVKVTEFEPARKMVWSSGMPLGLFRGERTFTLTPSGDGVVQFRMREVFQGLLSPLIERSIPDLQPTFEEFAAALQKRAEGGV